MQYGKLFEMLMQAMEEHGVKALLVGGWAVGYHGASRQTIDIDFVIAEGDDRPVEDMMESLAFKQVAHSHLFAKYRHSAIGEACPDVDFLFLDQRSFGRLAKEGQWAQLAGVTVPVVGLSHLLGMKIHALRHGRAERAGKDLPDIINLIKANGLAVEGDELRAIALKYGTPEIYDEIRTLVLGS
jgi:hypothetical protein